MYNVDIDTGGTMTDGLVSGEDTVLALKVETTPHDVTIAFVDILEAARDALGFGDLRALLTQVEVIRWSSTITSNVLAQRTGPVRARSGETARSVCPAPRLEGLAQRVGPVRTRTGETVRPVRRAAQLERPA